jgi:hypothetical protein
MSGVPGSLQDARPAGTPGPVAAATVAPMGSWIPAPRRDAPLQGGAAPEQGGPVLDEALGIAERARGERGQISDTHD